ncbi:MAG TPA: hypothetical protein VHK88_00045 [Aquihabitans sp.]|nr:hypothetical protein [Aquihabitans sp.]
MQHGVVGGVADHPVGEGVEVGVRIELHDDQIPAGGRHLGADGPADAPPAADDDVVPERGRDRSVGRAGGRPRRRRAALDRPVARIYCH